MRFAFALLAGLSVACAADPPPSPPPPPVGTPATSARRESSSAPPLPPVPAPNGVPTVDPRVAELAKKVLACEYKPDAFSPLSGCAAFDAWSKEDELFAEGKNDAALVAMLERGAEPERYLAAYKLDRSGKV